MIIQFQADCICKSFQKLRPTGSSEISPSKIKLHGRYQVRFLKWPLGGAQVFPKRCSIHNIKIMNHEGLFSGQKKLRKPRKLPFFLNNNLNRWVSDFPFNQSIEAGRWFGTCFMTFHSFGNAMIPTDQGLKPPTSYVFSWDNSGRMKETQDGNGYSWILLL